MPVLSKGFTMHQQEKDTMPAVLIGESRILELISTGAPLRDVQLPSRDSNR
jgi:hypothetical protein